MSNSNQGQQRRRRRQRVPPSHRRIRTSLPTNETANPTSISEELFQKCEKIKEKILASSAGQSDLWLNRQELLDQYEQLVLFDLDFALEKKIEHDLWTIVFKNDMTQKQEQLKFHQQNPNKRTEIQTSLQILYEYARGYYLKLLQDVIHCYNFQTSICKLSFSYLQKRNTGRQCKDASMVYFIQHILVHIGDLNRYSNQIDLAKIFYQYAIETIPCLGQPYNQIAILHEMKHPSSLLTPGQHQLITTYYYVRSIAIKVTFPLAIANLEKLFQRLKDLPLTRYEQIELSENDFLSLFLQLTAMINLDRDSTHIEPFMSIFRSKLMKHFNMSNFIQMITIIMFTCHRALAYLPRASASNKPSEQQFDKILQLFLIIIEQCLETSQLPLSMMVIDEQHLLPILYLSFAYLANIQKTKLELFNHSIFKQKPAMWNSLAKLLRSFGVLARNFETNKDCNASFFVKYADYPLTEERTLECFTPLNDLLKGYNFKKYQSGESQISEKDERQLRKLRFVFTVKNLCQKVDDQSKKKIFDYLLTYVKDDLIYFESSVPSTHEIPSSNFGAPGDHRRNIQKSNNDDTHPVHPNGNHLKTPRGARNVALRQFLEPVLAATENTANQKTSPKDSTFLPTNQRSAESSDPWPRLSESKDLFQQRSIDDESHVNSVWSHPNEIHDRFNPSVLQPNVTFGSSSSQATKK